MLDFGNNIPAIFISRPKEVGKGVQRLKVYGFIHRGLVWIKIKMFLTKKPLGGGR
jgi:hypothetical protein